MSTDTQTALVDWVERTPEAQALERCAALLRVMAEARGLPLDTSAPELLVLDVGMVVPDGLEMTPWVLGRLHEVGLGAAHRHTMGVHYTPVDTALRLARVAVGTRIDPKVCDPSVGGGAFLLAAAEALEDSGHVRTHIVENLLWGIDIDPEAVLVARAALALWAASTAWPSADPNIVEGDALSGRIFGNSDFNDFDVVVGNPPFQNQLQATTTRTTAELAQLRSRFGIEAGPYMDTAAWFLAAGVRMARPGATVLLVQPESSLVADSAGPVRAHISQAGHLRGLWTADAGLFDAQVRVCAPVISVEERGDDMIERWHGAAVTALGPEHDPGPASWSPLLASVRGVPAVDVAGDPLSTVAGATAGFRDEFYGLADHTGESASSRPDAPLVTVGMIDPLRNRWGTRAFRYAGEHRLRPSIDLQALEADNPKLAGWVRERRHPKVLVATQTKVVEVAVDADGAVVPCTPVIAVSAPVEMLWHIAAALSSPPVSAVALQRVAGAALSSETIKLSARQVLELPLPTDREDWDLGADLARRAAEATTADEWATNLLAMGERMCSAYEVSNGSELFAWWRSRLPDWR